jgi:hypothetical protein
MLNNIRALWTNSVKEIGRKDWIEIFGNKRIHSYELFVATEDARFRDINYRYLSVYDGDRIMAIAACLNYKMDIADIVANKYFSKFVDGVRSVIYPDFFKLKTFVVGSYMATCEHFVNVRKDMKPEEYEKVCSVIREQIRAKSIEDKHKLVFIKDVRKNQLDYVQGILGSDYHFFDTFPTTAIPVLKDADYPKALKKKHRKRYVKYKEMFDERLKWEIIQDFEDYTDIYEELYLRVVSKAKNKFEVLNRDFFSNVNKAFPDKSFMLVSREADGEIRSMEFIVEEEDRLLPLYIGINYKNDNTKIMYLNTIFRTVKEAEKRGKALVDFGQTSYYPKVMSGALVEKIYYGFFSTNKTLQYIIRNVFKSVFIPMEIPDNVYLAQYREDAVAALESKGFEIVNK